MCKFKIKRSNFLNGSNYYHKIRTFSKDEASYFQDTNLLCALLNSTTIITIYIVPLTS